MISSPPLNEVPEAAIVNDTSSDASSVGVASFIGTLAASYSKLAWGPSPISFTAETPIVYTWATLSAMKVNSLRV